MFQKKVRDKFDFCTNINIAVFFKLIVSFLVPLVEHVQRTQNNKFAKPFEHPNEGRRDEVGYFFFFLITIKVFYNFTYPFWWTYPGIPKVLKLTKKQSELRNWFFVYCYITPAVIKKFIVNPKILLMLPWCVEGKYWQKML